MQRKEQKKKIGRPSSYNLEMAKEICRIVAITPYSLHKICEDNDHLPEKDAIQEWRLKHREFAALYAQAKHYQVDAIVEEMMNVIEISHKDSFGPDRLKVDTYKWISCKLAPKIYGDKVQLEQKSEENEKLKEELLALRAKLDKKNKKDY